ncbi:hypothetical protein Tco_0507708 [Tanacetum coccineum]
MDVGLREADSETSSKKSMKKAFQDMLHELGEVNLTHAYYNDFLNEEGNGNQPHYESSDEYYSSDEVEEFDYVDFNTEGQENVVIKNLTTQDPFLNKLCSNHGTFKGFIDELVPVDQEPIEDLDDANIDPLFKVKRGVSYPKHDPAIPWNEMQLFLGLRYENLEQLKLALANYGVASGYQLWHVQQQQNVVQKKFFDDDSPKSDKKSKVVKKPMLGKKGKPAKKATKPSKKVTSVKKGKPVRKSVSFSPNVTTRSNNSREGCSRDGEGCSRDAEKSPQSPKWTKCKILQDKHRGLCRQPWVRMPTIKYPIAWAIVRVENTYNWCWFLALLHDDLNLQQGTGLTLISDSHKGLHEDVMRFLALGWHLEEINVTWAHLEKKRTRLRLYTISLKKLCIQSVKTASRVSSDGVRTFEVTASEIW